MNFFIVLITIFLIQNNGSPVKSIIEYNGEDSHKIRQVKFDKQGRELETIYFHPFSKTERKKSRQIVEYDLDGRKKKISYYYYNINNGEIISKPFSELIFDYSNQKEVRIMYEDDTLIRYIQEVIRFDNITIEKTYTWELYVSLSTKPDTSKALILTDTIFYDNFEREIKRLNYSSAFDNPYIETYNYQDDGVIYNTVGTAKDTTIMYPYSELQKFCKAQNLDYDFRNSFNHKFEVEYY